MLDLEDEVCLAGMSLINDANLHEKSFHCLSKESKRFLCLLMKDE